MRRKEMLVRVTRDRPHPGLMATWSLDEPYPRIPQWTVDHVYGCLQVADELFTTLGIPYMAFSGTLLGAVRHGGMIPWDTDGDLCVRPEDLRAVRGARQFLAKRGFGLGRDRAFSVFKVYPLDGYKVRPWHEYRFPYVDLFEDRAGRLTYASAKARRTWSKEYFENADFTTLSRYPFGPHTLTAPPAEVTHTYLDRFLRPVMED